MFDPHERISKRIKRLITQLLVRGSPLQSGDLINAQDGTTTTKFVVQAGGNVGIGMNVPSYQLQLSTDSAAKPGTSTGTIAFDERLKDIRAPFTRGLKELDGLHTIYFNYKKDNPLSLPSDKELIGIAS